MLCVSAFMGSWEERFLSVLTIQRTFCSRSWAALDKLEIFFGLGLWNFLLIYTVVSMLNKQRLLGLMKETKKKSMSKSAMGLRTAMT